jgi:parvulin-like peptidyl-prolyl isomerase
VPVRRPYNKRIMIKRATNLPDSDIKIVTESTEPLAEPLQRRIEQNLVSPQDHQDLDQLGTPLERLCNDTMSGAEVMALLKQHALLPQLQRELIIDQALADVSCSQEEVFSAYKAFYQKYKINSDQDRAVWLKQNHFSLDQFEHLVLRTIKLDRFKHSTFSNRVDSYFLQRKAQLDRATYSLLRVKDPHLAQELFFRIQDGEANFTDLVKQYSGGQEAEIGGLVGPHDMTVPHPDLARKILSLKAGQLAPPVKIADWFVIVRLEKYLPAQLDQDMRGKLIGELYAQWLQNKLNQLVTKA